MFLTPRLKPLVVVALVVGLVLAFGLGAGELLRWMAVGTAVLCALAFFGRELWLGVLASSRTSSARSPSRELPRCGRCWVQADTVCGRVGVRVGVLTLENERTGLQVDRF
jgi:TRAP-type C4-dicarboxylate transport system permease small subunit